VAVASINGELRFPLCWTSAPVAVLGYDFQKMMPYEQGVVGFLDKMLLFDIHQLLKKVGDSEILGLYLCEYCDIFVFRRFLLYFF
jgi:hypothetical protein